MRRQDISRLEAFSDAVFGFALALLISAGVGVLSFAIASFAPLELAPIAPTVYCLMAPAHFGYGSQSGKKRRLLEERLAGVVPAAVSMS